MALLPLLVFIVLYLVVSLILNDFYKVPIIIAFLASSIVGIITLQGRPLKERIKIFSRGASSENMMLMIWIFILAGAFASTAKDMGSIDNTVNMTLALLPPQMLMASIFFASCFISLSIGTSVGTVVALTPIATGLAEPTGINTAMMCGIVVGGAFFGDNLSFISDTTVAATQTQGCKMVDKFRANFKLVTPAAIIIFILYIILGLGKSTAPTASDVEYVKVLPYLVVLITAIFGLNVMIVLLIGIIMAGTIGIIEGAYDIFGFIHSMNKGILGMSELIIITMLAGGMLEVVKQNNGIELIIKYITKHINSRKGGEFAIAGLVTIVNICTANNTVAIITVGPIARQIAEKFKISPQRSASLLDTFSCFSQGIIPYGAQLLMAAGLTAISPMEIVPYLYYPYLIGIISLLAIITGLTKKYTKQF